MSKIFIFWKPDMEFTTSLSINTCWNRLEDLGASAYEVRWFWDRSGLKKIHFFLKGRNYSFWKQGPALSGVLTESEDGTRVAAFFEPNRPFSSITVLFAFSLYLIFWQKSFLWVIFFLLVLFINLGFIFSFLSAWEGMEIKINKNLRFWKRYK